MADSNPIVLRPYQENLIKNAGVILRQGKKAPILVLPTGGGKTVVFSEICKRAKGHNSNILILVHRRELIKQSAKKLNKYLLSNGVAVRYLFSYGIEYGLRITLGKKQELEKTLKIIKKFKKTNEK